MLVIKEDIITFHIEKTHQTFKAKILKDDSKECYFVGRVEESVNGMSLFRNNDDFLIAAGFNTKTKQKDLYESVLGYWINGSESKGWWPWCRTREDMMKILKHLDKDNNKNFISLRFVI